MDRYHCSFCGKRRSEVRKLISGPRALICDECVARCLDFLARPEPRETASQALPKGAKTRCGFCRKLAVKVDVLIAGPIICICDECIGLCQDIIEEEIDKQKHDAAKPPS